MFSIFLFIRDLCFAKQQTIDFNQVIFKLTRDIFTVFTMIYCIKVLDCVIFTTDCNVIILINLTIEQLID